MWMKLFLAMILIPGMILPAWRDLLKIKRINVCDRVIGKRCIYKAYTIEDYLKKVAKGIEQYSELYHLDPIMLLTIIKIESGFNPNIVGKDGEIGLCQIVPYGLAYKIGNLKIKRYRTNKTILLKPEENIRICAKYLNYCRFKCNTNNVDIIANCHNTGYCKEVINKRYLIKFRSWYNRIKKFIGTIDL